MPRVLPRLSHRLHPRDHGPGSHASWKALAQRLDAFCASKGFSTVVLLGVGFELPDAWSKAQNGSRPKGMESNDTLDKYRAAFREHRRGPLFPIKSDSAADASSHDIIETHLKDAISEPPMVVGAEKRDGGKVLGACHRRPREPC